MNKLSSTRTWTALLSGPAIVAAVLVLTGSSSAKPHSSVATPAVSASERDATQDKPDDLGATTYTNQCSLCHGVDRKGVPPTFPSLLGVTTRYTDAQITDIVHNGKGRMPARPSLEPAAVTAVIAYLKTAPVDAPADPKPATP